MRRVPLQLTIEVQVRGQLTADVQDHRYWVPVWFLSVIASKGAPAAGIGSVYTLAALDFMRQKRFPLMKLQRELERFAISGPGVQVRTAYWRMQGTILSIRMVGDTDEQPVLAAFARADEFLAGVQKLIDLDLQFSSADDATVRDEQRLVEKLCSLVRNLPDISARRSR